MSWHSGDFSKQAPSFGRFQLTKPEESNDIWGAAKTYPAPFRVRSFFHAWSRPSLEVSSTGCSILLSLLFRTPKRWLFFWLPSLQQSWKLTGELWKTIFLLGNPFVHFHDCWKEGTFLKLHKTQYGYPQKKKNGAPV